MAAPPQVLFPPSHYSRVTRPDVIRTAPGMSVDLEPHYASREHPAGRASFHETEVFFFCNIIVSLHCSICYRPIQILGYDQASLQR